MTDRETIAVGFFDGVHLGHRQILRGAKSALTFANHPLSILAPERAPALIMPSEERLAAMRACGVAEVTALDFTPGLAAMTAAEFAARYLSGRGDGRLPVIRCGANWRFGRGAEGDAAFLRGIGYEVEVAPLAEHLGEAISSSRIRACLARGEIGDANAMMGRLFEVTGMRTRGKGLGMKIGYPTVNLRLATCRAPLVTLPRGVYEVEMFGRRGVANYGLAPTLGERSWKTPVLEVHLVLPSGSVFADSDEPSVRVSFVRRLRSERTFDSLDALRRQIAADCDRICP